MILFVIFHSSSSAFNQISIEIPKNVREFSIAVASIADSFGIALAGFTGITLNFKREFFFKNFNLFLAIPVHNAICSFGNK